MGTQNSLPKDVNDELMSACQDFKDANYSREALNRLAADARTLLAGHEEALRLFEGTILKTPGVWDRMHERAEERQNIANKNGDGNDVLGSCERPSQ